LKYSRDTPQDGLQRTIKRHNSGLEFVRFADDFIIAGKELSVLFEIIPIPTKERALRVIFLRQLIRNAIPLFLYAKKQTRLMRITNSILKNGNMQGSFIHQRGTGNWNGIIHSKMESAPFVVKK